MFHVWKSRVAFGDSCIPAPICRNYVETSSELEETTDLSQFWHSLKYRHLVPGPLMAMAVARPLRPQPTARARQERQLELLSRIFSMLIGYARFHLKVIVIARFYFLQEFQGSRLCFLCPYANNTMRAIAGPLCNEVCLDLEGHYCSCSLPYRKAARANS